MRRHEAGRKVNGRKRRMAVNATGTTLSMSVHESSVRDGDGAIGVIGGLPRGAPKAHKLLAGHGRRTPKPRPRPEGKGISAPVEIVPKPKGGGSRRSADCRFPVRPLVRAPNA